MALSRLVKSHLQQPAPLDLWGWSDLGRMMWHIDHLAVVCRDLRHGVALVEETLGVTMRPGGRHARFATHNALLGLAGGLYLEVIAPDPEAKTGTARWFGLDQIDAGSRLGNWICRVPDLGRALALSPPDAGDPVEMERADLHWTIAVPKDGSLPMQGGWPTLIEWAAGTHHPAQRLPVSGCALSALTILHPNADAIRVGLAGMLTDPRLRFETAARPGLVADFETPDGPRRLQ